MVTKKIVVANTAVTTRAQGPEGQVLHRFFQSEL